MKKVICDICGREFDGNRCADENGYTKIAHVEVMDSRYFQGEYDICNNCFTDIRNFIDDHRKAMIVKRLKNVHYVVKGEEE